MTKKIYLVLAIFTFSLMGNVKAQKLKKFSSSIEKKIGPKTVKIPYTDVTSYLGYAEPGNEDEIKDGKKYYYIYVWIPLIAPELGIRMLSPVGKTKVNKKAIKSPEYLSNKKSADYFDTYITLEKSNILTKEQISKEAVSSANWTLLSRNDDSGEMPKQPSGSSYNSLLRYKSQTNNPLKALTAGLYRIGFTTYKTGEVKGTFLAEVAAPIKLPGVLMVKNVESLID